MKAKAYFDNLVAALAKQDTNTAFDAAHSLWTFVSQGGFKPRIPAKTYISVSNGGQFCYSILSRPDGQAEFIRYIFNHNTGEYEDDHVQLMGE
jgi:hypothetical protein